MGEKVRDYECQIDSGEVTIDTMCSVNGNEKIYLE